ncbi:hypothetical protein [Lysinibacillus fusiformis]|uniref:hypothetical protein n=1 Tax=Lysinibacillus fusiformis TaxID=28031 RepID=UPI003CFCF948
MIIDELIRFHKDKLNNRNLIFKHIKKETTFRLFFLIITAITIVVGLLMKNPYIFLASIIIYVYLLISTNKKMKKILLTIHKLKVGRGFSWDQLTYYKVKQLKIFLKDKNILSKESIQEYIKYLEKESEHIKITNYIRFGIPGLILALFIPVWNHFNSWYMKNQVDSFIHAIKYLILCFLLIVILSFILGTISNLFRELFETKYRRYNELISLLELIYLSIDETISDESIYKNL